MMFIILNPLLFNALTADSLPGPGPLTLTSKFFIPDSLAMSPALSAATCAAKGVLLREPLNPDPPAVAHERVFPCRSVIVTIVLLKEAYICAIPSITVFLTFFLDDLATAFAISFDPKIYLFMGRRGPFRVRAFVFVL